MLSHCLCARCAGRWLAEPFCAFLRRVNKIETQLLRNANGRRFKENKILDLFGQIAQGMYHVHSLNILHRDLKTANILLTREG